MVSLLLRRAQLSYRKEGLYGLLKRSLSYISQRIIRIQHCYVLEHPLMNLQEKDFFPKRSGFTYRMISDKQQIQDLMHQGFEDIRDTDVIVEMERSLDAGAIAFCYFIGKELAHIGWIALHQEAKNTFDIIPYQVDFTKGQACTGGTVSISKFRGTGFMTYGYYHRLQYLWEQGYNVSRNAVEKKNLASRKVHSRFDNRITAEALFVQILGFKMWREKPVTGKGSLHDVK